jgi:hypothetical protein
MAEAAIIAIAGCGFALAALEVICALLGLNASIAWVVTGACVLFGILASTGCLTLESLGLGRSAARWMGRGFLVSGVLVSWILLGAPWLGDVAEVGLVRVTEAGKIGPVAPILGMLMAMGLAGSVAALLRGVSPQQAAAFLDSRGGLEERVTTAVEVARSDRSDTPLAWALCSQAVEAVSGTDARRLSPWRIGPRGAWTCALAISLAVVAAFLPGVWPEEGESLRSPGLSALVPRLSQGAAPGLSVELRDLAASAEQPSELREAAADAAEAIESGAEVRWKKALARMDASLPLLDEAERSRVLAGLLAAAEGLTDAREAEAESPESSAASQPELLRQMRRVRVYDPLYREARGPETPSLGADDRSSQGAQADVPLEDAWARARERAGGAVRVPAPPEYGVILRRYFGTEQ